MSISSSSLQPDSLHSEALLFPPSQRALGSEQASYKDLVFQLSREQRKIQDLLSSLGFALRSFNNINQLLDLVPFMACRVTDAHAGVIVLSREGRPWLEKLYCSQPPALQDLQNALTQAGNQPLPTDSGVWDTRLREHLSPTLSIFSTPILVKSTVRGYLSVLSQQPDYQWSEDRLKLLRLVADQTAVAIENEELSSELRRKEKFAREIDIGSEIQERLQPKAFPTIPGLAIAARCENASKVGGDYYDFIPIGESQRWGLVLGDVMGKGVPAGLLMMMTRGTLRSEVQRGTPPDELLNHLNKVLYPDLENSNRFLTLFYAEYDPECHCLRYSNAAHPRPLHWQAQTQQLHTLETAGTLIGLTDDTLYPSETVYLKTGDVVVCYTDGFTEAANETGRLGEEKFTEVVAWACANHDTPEKIIDYLYAQIREFRGDQRRGDQRPDDRTIDDMTIMVLKAR